MYDFNHDFFKPDHITLESTYWAGYLVGTAHIKHNTLCIRSRNLRNLRAFRRAISSSAPIRKYKRTSYELTITSAELCKDLSSFGLVPLKSHRLLPPKVVIESSDTSLSDAFIDGYLDGKDLSTHDPLELNCSSPAFLEFLYDHYAQKSYHIHRSKRGTRLTVTRGPNPLKVY